MAVIDGDLYFELVRTGVTEAEAQAAAAVSADRASPMRRIERDLNVLQWMIGCNLLLSLVCLGLLLATPER